MHLTTIAVEQDSLGLHHLSQTDRVSLRRLRLELEEQLMAVLLMVEQLKPRLVVMLLVQYLRMLFLP